MTVLKRAQSRGYVKDYEGEYVAEGLRHGFKLGVDFDILRRNGRRIFKNYKSAYDNHASVSNAVQARLCKGKTVCLGRADTALVELGQEFNSLACFPMGAVLKPNQDPSTPPDQLVYRPTAGGNVIVDLRRRLKRLAQLQRDGIDINSFVPGLSAYLPPGARAHIDAQNEATP